MCWIWYIRNLHEFPWFLWDQLVQVNNIKHIEHMNKSIQYTLFQYRLYICFYESLWIFNFESRLNPLHLKPGTKNHACHCLDKKTEESNFLGLCNSSNKSLKIFSQMVMNFMGSPSPKNRTIKPWNLPQWHAQENTPPCWAHGICSHHQFWVPLTTLAEFFGWQKHATKHGVTTSPWIFVVYFKHVCSHWGW